MRVSGGSTSAWAAQCIHPQEYFTVPDAKGETWYCLIMEKLECSLFDFVQANQGAGY